MQRSTACLVMDGRRSACIQLVLIRRVSCDTPAEPATVVIMTVHAER